LSQRSISAFFSLSLLFPLALLTACSASGGGSSNDPSSDGSGNGNGNGNGAPGTSGSTSSGPMLDDDEIMMGSAMPETCGAVLPTVYRDFKGVAEPGGHGDFETSARNVHGPDGMLYKGWNDVGCGLVEATLGSDGKPAFYAGPADVAQGGPPIRAGVGRQKRVVSGSGCWPSTTGVCNVGTCAPWNFDPPTYAIESATTFNQWYRTTPNVNMEIPGELPLLETAPGSGVSVYDSNAFFPLDNQGFGNTPGQTHNYHFTTEIHVKFQYQAQQVFTFRGDDDLWIYVNGKLALDVGGLHEDLEGTIDFDKQAAALGITVGSTYQMDIFHAERQTSESNFRIETNIRCFENVPVK
jgi:fibro-slime domain-containing protein